MNISPKFFISATIFTAAIGGIILIIAAFAAGKKNMLNNKAQLIKTIYFYLISLIGLLMIVFSSAQLINLGLKTWVFTEADNIDRYYEIPPAPYFLDKNKIQAENIKKCSEKCELSEEEKQQIANWLVDYKNWKEKNNNPEAQLRSRRQRDAVTSISFLLVGIPLFWYHWGVLRRKKNDE